MTDTSPINATANSGQADAARAAGGGTSGTSEAKRSARRSMLFVGGVFLAAAVAWGGMQLVPAPDTDQRKVQVIDGSGQQHLYPLGKDGVYTVTTGFGTNTIEVKDGEVWMQDSTCPNHDCIEQGHVHNTTGYILCLPNQLMVSIIDDEATANSDTHSIDAIAS